MKKLVVAISAVALVFAGCSKNETVNAPVSGEDVIAFGPYSHLASRGVPINDNAAFSANENAFGLVAFFNGTGVSTKPYLGTGEGTVESPAGPITVTSDGTSWTYPNVKYWPSDGLDFYAYAPYTDVNATREFSFAQDQVKVDYSVPATVANQQDFMVAAQMNKTKADIGVDKKLAMPFRHALTQIVFKFANTSSTLDIQVTGVQVNEAKSEGTFTFNTASAPEYGTWVPLGSPLATYSQNLATPLTVPSELPDSPVAMENDHVMMLLPQGGATTPWNPANPTNDGTSIDINCIIKDHDSGLVLWGDGTQEEPTAKALRIGVDFSDWAMGKRVIYCITFGTDGGTAGNDPTTGEPVLLPILFSSSVVGWDDVNHNISI